MKVALGFVCCTALLLLAAPAAAQTGACWFVDDELFETPTQGGGVCVDDVPEAACLEIDEDPEVELTWSEGETCEEIAAGFDWEEWDGICIFFDDILEQDLCAWIGVEPVDEGVEVGQFCEDEEFLGGEWLPEALVCPEGTAIRVPAVPGLGLQLLALLLVIGGLLVMLRMRRLAAR